MKHTVEKIKGLLTFPELKLFMHVCIMFHMTPLLLSSQHGGSRWLGSHHDKVDQAKHLDLVKSKEQTIEFMEAGKPNTLKATG